VGDLEDHTPDLWRVVVRDDMLHVADAERPHRAPLVAGVTRRALDLADADLRHRAPPASARTSPRACGRAALPRPAGGAGASSRPPWPSPGCAGCGCRGTS